MVRKNVNKRPMSITNEYHCQTVEQDCLRVNFNRINLVFRIVLNEGDDVDKDSDYMVMSHTDAAVLASDIQEHLMETLLKGNTNG